MLHYLPIVQANRVPNRFSIVLVLCLALLVAHALYRLTLWLDGLRVRLAWQGKGARLVVGVPVSAIAVVLLFEHLVVPLPLTDARVPAFYETLGRNPADYSILQLPLGWRNSFRRSAPKTLACNITRVCITSISWPGTPPATHRSSLTTLHRSRSYHL